MLKACLALLPLMLPLLPLTAQSVSPPLVEYREKAKGSFTVTNNSLFPLTVVLTPRGFVVDEAGNLSDVPLDTARVKLKLSTLSFRLQPRQVQTVFYDVTTDSVPTWFSVWSGITGAKTDGGINLRIELPHVVYINQKAKLTAQDIELVSARYSAADKQVTVEFRNKSNGLIRVQEVVATNAEGRRQDGPGFPLFPNSTRRAQFAWNDSLPPTKVDARFDGFRLDTQAILTDAGDVRAGP